MQAAIDSAKRRFAVDIASEIKRIKKDMNVKQNGYPRFWMGIRPTFNKQRINSELVCPMNLLYDMQVPKSPNTSPLISFDKFFIRYPYKECSRVAKKIEALIEKYSLNIKNYRIGGEELDEDYLLSWSNFDELIEDIRMCGMSHKYVHIMSYLINRGFLVTPNMRGKSNKIQSKLSKNRSILLKTLYEVNHECFLECFNTTIQTQ